MRPRHLLLAIVLTAAAIFGTTAVFAAEAPAQLDPARALELELQQAIAKASPAFAVVSNGSGIVISADGWLLTNHHVVAQHTIGHRWWIRLAGDKPYIARLVGSDPRGDIALLKVESDTPLPFVKLASVPEATVGELAFALGNPFGLAQDAQPTCTFGIISAIHLHRGGYSDAIQTDASLNPGNSGGPLLNMAGHLIGINGRIAVRFGNRMNTGVGYAIPVSQIRRFLPLLKAGGVISHGSLKGMRFHNATPAGSGVNVTRVGASSATPQGFKLADRIVAVDGRPVANVIRLQSIVGSYPAGAKIHIEVMRNDVRTKLATVLAGDAPKLPSTATGYLGIHLSTEDNQNGEHGVLVLSVVEGSPAATAGIKAADRLIEYAGKPVNSLDDVSAIVRTQPPGTPVDITLSRGGEELSLSLVLGKRPE